ncbi:MAG: S8 family serine peptidase, partial [Fimbriimonadales bacterium]|nr:S8 family serine peptidase [Fimbriimonadales bacterium]
FYDFYPYNAYQARIPVDVLNRLEATPAVRWVGMPEPIQKLDPELLPLMQKGSAERVQLYVNLIGDDSIGSVRAMLQAAGLTVYKYYPDLRFYYAEGNAQAIWNALALDSVLFIEPVPLSVAMHTESQPSVNADRLWGLDIDGRPRDGRQIKIGVMDSGMNTSHQDFSNLAGGMWGFNRTTEQNWWNDVHGHGTHVSGTLFGQGNAQFRYRGFASGFRESDLEQYDLLHSKVFRYDSSTGRAVSEGNSVMDGLEDMRGHGSNAIKRHVFNYSGGFSGTNLTGTDAQSRTVDLAFGEDILPVISAGNNGPGAGTVGSPGVAKGALTVGSIWDDGATTTDTMANFSSRGPTGDGRFKPDVVAPGLRIDSTSNTSNTGYLLGWSGTSMAAPHVAGLAATLKQHYNTPAWATRAIIMATAIDLGHGRNNQGLGKIDALLAHFAWNGGWYTHWWSNGGTGDLRYVDVNVPAGCTKLRVVLVYPDPPASAGASVALVNDLDLYVQTGTLTTTPSGQWYSLSARNNVEVVEIDNPAAGTYRIKVYTYALNSGSSQNWAFTIHWTFGSQSPNVNLTLSAPVAVRPNTNFTVTGTASAGSYVASGVYAELTVPTGGLTRNGLTFFRRAPNGGEESVYFAGVFGKNMGNIGHTLSRRFDWSMTSGSTEGVHRVRMSVDSSNGGSASLEREVIVDGTPPTNWSNFSPADWVNTQTPTCSIQVQDVLAGLDTSALYYWYYTPSTGVQGPFNATTSASNGTTALATINAPSVPFNRDSSGPETQVYFRAYDRAGNFSDSGWREVRIDTVAPGDWQNFTPSGTVFGTRITCTVQVRDLASGLHTGLGYYRYSTDGGVNWSTWIPASTTGANGTTAFQTITAPNVPFPDASETQNQIQFAIRDMAGNWGYSPTYTVRTTNTFTLTDGSASYTVYNTFGTALRLSGSAGFTDFNAGAGDRMYQQWWWYRTQGSNREFALSNLVGYTRPSANRIILTYEEPVDVNPALLYRFQIEYRLVSVGAGAARVIINYTVANLTSSSHMLNLFHYADFWISSAQPDTIQVLSPGRIRQVFGEGGCAELNASPVSTRWEVGVYPTLRNKLTDTVANDLSNSTSASGDVTAAMQWTRTLGAGASFSGVVVQSLNTSRLSGDVNGDCIVDDADLLEVLFNFGATGNTTADVNCDGVVDDADLLIVLFNFGSGC